MTTYSLTGFAAVFDTAADTVLSVDAATMDFVWFDGRAPTLRYDYTAANSLGARLTTTGSASAAISGPLSISGYGLTTTDEVFRFSWDANGVTRTTTVLSRLVSGADLSGPAANRSVMGVFALAGDELPPMPSIAYFARFMLTQIDQTSYAIPTGTVAPAQAINLATLPAASSAETDHVIGAATAEVLNAGQGDDTINGKGGADVIAGQAGNDLITGGAGRDTLGGGIGRDTLSYLDEGGSRGVTVSLLAGTATDTFGDADNINGFEDVQGSWLGDRLTGDGLANRLLGYGGADSLNGATGADTLTGGAGNDTLTGGGDIDEADYGAEGGPMGIEADLAAGTVRDTFGDTDRLSGIVRITGTKYADLIRGGSFAATLTGGIGIDTLLGGSGAESILGEGGWDVIGGGAGNDTLDGGEGQDTVSYAAETGGQGIVLNLATLSVTDTFGFTDSLRSVEVAEGSRYDDLMYSAGSGALMMGGAGRDTMHGRGGSDSLEGGADNDTLIGNGGADRFDGGAGIDAVDYANEAGGRAISADLGTGRITDTYGLTDTVTAVENVIGTDLADFLRGDDIANLLSGGNGDDQIYGMGGNDSIQAGNGNDTVGAGDGNDTLRGGSGSDLLGGGNDHDMLYGEDGNDFLRAGPGNDRLEGGAGIDALTGSYGNDTIYGGGDGDSIAGSYGADLLFGEGGNDQIGGGDQNDTIDGGAGNDTILGGSGHDSLRGGAGNDQISDGFGHDTIDGGAGRDTITLGPDADTVRGGAEADVFVFNTTTRVDLDRIEDFELGLDRLQVTGYGTGHLPDVQDWVSGGEHAADLIFGNLIVRLIGYDSQMDLAALFAP